MISSKQFTQPVNVLTKMFRSLTPDGKLPEGFSLRGEVYDKIHELIRDSAEITGCWGYFRDYEIFRFDVDDEIDIALYDDEGNAVPAFVEAQGYLTESAWQEDNTGAWNVTNIGIEFCKLRIVVFNSDNEEVEVPIDAKTLELTF